jgi:hypothetical protein
MEHDWTKIHFTKNPIEAEMIKDLLMDHDVQAVILNKQDSAYPLISEIEIYCHAENALKAIKLISDFQR